MTSKIADFRGRIVESFAYVQNEHKDRGDGFVRCWSFGILFTDGSCLNLNCDGKRDAIIARLDTDLESAIRSGVALDKILRGGEGDHTPASTESPQSEPRSSAGGAATFSDPVE